jgi:hypothetical protein
MTPAASGIVALAKPGTIARKLENVARQVTRATVNPVDGCDILLGSILMDHELQVSAAFAVDPERAAYLVIPGRPDLYSRIDCHFAQTGETRSATR